MITPNLMASLLKKSPNWLLVSIALGFTSCFVYFFLFYKNNLLGNYFAPFPAFLLSFFVAAMVQIMRFSFALSGSFDFARGNKKSAVWGLGMSGGITAFEIIESVFSAQKISPDNYGSLLIFILSPVVFSFIVEIRLCLLMAGAMQVEMIEASTEQDRPFDFRSLSRDEKIRYIKLKRQMFTDEKGRKPKLRELREYVGSADISLTTIQKYLK